MAVEKRGWQAAGSERFRPVAEFMQINPADRLLEIGCGNGVSVEILCPLLDTGSILAIDRSEKMIERARTRNMPHLTSGKATFLVSTLAAFRPAERFGKIFAVNVNLFWTDGSRGPGAVRSLLAPGGALFLFFQPPAGNDTALLRAKLHSGLQAASFRISREEEQQTDAVVTVCLEARLE